MASGNDQLALFNQYDDEYCAKSTDVANSIQKISSLSGGESDDDQFKDPALRPPPPLVQPKVA